MKGIFPIDKFRTLQTPFYYYDTKVLRDTLSAINQEVAKYPNYSVHYAVKANANPKVLTIIRESGMGADCVSGGEIRAAIRAGFPASKIVFAGVGKADWEINLGLEYGIFCFNVESIPELEVINELAAAQNKIANVAFRINPDVGAHTHANITTGLAENKFGISMQDMDKVIDVAVEMKHVKFIGLHFHIGSQILDMGDFIALCNRVNELQDKLEARRILVEHINVGGGLGIDYGHPNRQPIPNFKDYFSTYAGQLKLRPYQTLHFELGRAVVGQCGSLISKVLYVKQGAKKKFAILHMEEGEWSPDFRYIGTLLSSGVPMGLQYSITAIGSVILQASVNELGSAAVASVTAGGKVNLFFTCPFDALGGTMATWAGQNVGAGKPERVHKGLMNALLLGAVYSVLACAFLSFFGKNVALLFLDSGEAEILTNAQTFLRVNSAAYLLLLCVNVFRFCIQGMGYSLFAILAGVFEMVARSIMGFGFVPKFGFFAVCFANPLAWLMADLFLIPAYALCLRRVKKRTQQFRRAETGRQ